MGNRVQLQSWNKWLGRFLCMIVFFVPVMLRAESVGKQIVDEAVDASDAKTLRLEIRFIMPVNYLWSFPDSRKNEFLIAVQPITGLADYDTAVREHIRIPDNLTNVIKDLYYDGTEGTNRFIVLETTQNMGMSVKQGRDMNKIIIEFASMAPKPAGESNRESKKGESGSKQK